MSDNVDCLRLKCLNLSPGRTTILSLPEELRIQVIHHIRNESLRSFAADPVKSMVAGQHLQQMLLDISSFHRDWTAVAQAELFSQIVLRTSRNITLFLEGVNKVATFRNLAQRTRRVMFGQNRGFVGKLGVLDELAEYCPRIDEISCYRTSVAIHEFSKRVVEYGLPPLSPSLTPTYIC